MFTYVPFVERMKIKREVHVVEILPTYLEMNGAYRELERWD